MTERFAQRSRHGRRRFTLLLLSIVLAATALRLLRLDALSLVGDESYYWLWSRHPAWAYYDHPAGVAALIRASTALGGSSPFGVRWLNAVVGVGCVVLTWLVGRQLLSTQAGLLAAAAVALGAPYLITSRFVYTNALSLFLTLWNLLAFWRMTREGAGWPEGLMFGITLALLFNTKYSAYAYALGLGIALLLDHRHLLGTRRLWTAAALGAIGLVPVVAWNAAHEWASFRWQFSHLTRAVVRDASLPGAIHHAWVYLTGPLLLLSLMGLGRVRTAAERLLTLVALSSLLPLALSAIDSPRNLSTGLVPLLLLAGTRLPRRLTTWSCRARAGALAVLLLGVALYGVGTVIGLEGPTTLPTSSIVPAIRRDAAGWSALGALLEGESEPIFALDYSIAAQIRFYAGRPAYTAWGQYRLWGIPPLQATTIVSLDYLDVGFVTDRLHEAFQHVEGPERLRLSERGATKVVHIWRAQGLQWDQQTFLRHFDFLTLLQEAS